MLYEYSYSIIGIEEFITSLPTPPGAREKYSGVRADSSIGLFNTSLFDPRAKSCCRRAALRKRLNKRALTRGMVQDGSYFSP